MSYSTTIQKNRNIISIIYAFFINTVDHSRVLLKDMDPDVVGSDYINANYVGVS